MFLIEPEVCLLDNSFQHFHNPFFQKMVLYQHFSNLYQCINDLPKGLSSNAKLFADEASLFSVIHDSSTTRNELNDDLVKRNNWAYQWKTSFNPDSKK